jgi:hypothetical protein
LEKTADDQLTQKTSETAKTPLEIAGQVAGFLGYFALMLKGEPLPDRSAARPPAPETREAAIAAADGAFRRLEQVLTELTDEDLARPLPLPWGGTMPTAGMVVFAIGAPLYFQGQLNYAQMIYGDLDPHIPDSWKPKAE